MDPLTLHTVPGLGNFPQSSDASSAARKLAVLAVEDRLGPYLVRRYIGRGFGYRMFEAEDPRTHQPVVARTLDASQGSEAALRFAREQDVLGRLPSDHFPRLLALGRLADGSPYYVMPLYYGESLPERLARGRLPLAAVLELGVGLMRALGALHAFGFMHGALRDEAVFLRQDQAGIRVALVDLGVCRRIALPASDPRADLHDAALLIYEALTGQPVPARIELHAAGRPQKLRPDCPPELEHVLLQLLGNTPAARPRTAREVRAELEAIARACALPVGYAAWQDGPESNPSSGPPAAMAWGPAPESNALAPPEMRIADGAAERAFFDDSLSAQPPPPRPRVRAPAAAPAPHWPGARWLPLVLVVVAIAGGFAGYAVLVGSEGGRLEEIAFRTRSWLTASRAPSDFASAPLAARDFPINPVLPLIPVKQGSAQPELGVQAVPLAGVRRAPSAASSSRLSARPVARRNSREQWDALPERGAVAAPAPDPPVPDTWDALPDQFEAKHRALVSDNPYE